MMTSTCLRSRTDSLGDAFDQLQRRRKIALVKGAAAQGWPAVRHTVTHALHDSQRVSPAKSLVCLVPEVGIEPTLPVRETGF